MPEAGEPYPLSSEALHALCRAVCERGAVFRFCAGGQSMHPAIREGDHLLIAPLGDLPPARGEVVVFSRPDAQDVVVHRVRRVGQGHALIKGDNVPRPDGLIPLENVFGAVIGVQRQGRALCWPDRRRRGRLAQAYFACWLAWDDARRLGLRIIRGLGRRARRLLGTSETGET